VAQSSVNELQPRGGHGRSKSAEREQWLLLYVGLFCAAALSLGLYLLRHWIARATVTETVAGIMVLAGLAGAIAVITAFLLFALSVDRSSEAVARALDAVAAGNLTHRLNAPRGLGREARLSGAAAAALARVRSWINDSQSAAVQLERNLREAHAPIAPMRDAIAGTAGHVSLLSRDLQFMAAAAEEHGALTQRACVLSSVIGQSHRDTSAFAERVQAAVTDAAAAVRDLRARVAELRDVTLQQREESARSLEAQQQLAEFLTAASKCARQFKLLALHGAMEAARADASSAQGTEAADATNRGAEFRVVAFEVRRLAAELAAGTEEALKLLDGNRRALQGLQGAAEAGTRSVDAALAAATLGAAALEHATNAVATRRADDAALAEAGTELTILTSSIRERVIGAGKAAGDLQDRAATLDYSLGVTDQALRELERGWQTVNVSLQQMQEMLATMKACSTPAPTPAAGAPATAPMRRARSKRERGRRVLPHPVGEAL
jgi:methyl-accepting chemotaxis protein